MEERDARTLKAEAQEELRRQAIKLLNKGMIQQDVADLLGVSRRAVGNWLKKYQSGGWSSLQKGKRGRKAGVHAQLTESQEQEVQKLMCDKTPDQLKMRFALWSREAVQSLIEDRQSPRISSITPFMSP